MLKSTFTLARVRGIELGLNWSWLIIFGLIVTSLAIEVFPRANPDLGAATYLAMAVVASLLFFSSLLAHELGHALQAEREGMQIEGITLWVFGGVAKFTGMFPSAGAEFRIAVAGPAVTFVIALLAAALSAIPFLPESVYGVIAWLGMINVVLLVFNMIPAFPLDGGRVLRSLLWRVKHDFVAATQTATAVGQVISRIFIALGVLLAVLAAAPSGLWLALLGWFILAAGRAEAQMVAMFDAFEGMRVADLMVAEPKTAPADATIQAFVDRLLPAGQFNAYPVVTADGTVIGLLPVRRLKDIAHDTWGRVTVADVMVPLDSALTMSPDRDLAQAVTEMLQTHHGRALVMSDGRLAGLLSITDARRRLEMPRSRGARVAPHST